MHIDRLISTWWWITTYINYPYLKNEGPTLEFISLLNLPYILTRCFLPPPYKKPRFHISVKPLFLPYYMLGFLATLTPLSLLKMNAPLELGFLLTTTTHSCRASIDYRYEWDVPDRSLDKIGQGFPSIYLLFSSSCC